MKIILNKDVYNLGEEGDICDVADGYARNFLLPKKLAVRHTNENVAIFNSRSSAIEKRKAEKRAAALSQKEKLEGLHIVIKMSAGDSGKLFGAVNAQTIVEALAKEGIQIEKKKIDVPSNTIKMLGDYQVLVKLYEKESATIKVTVVDERAEKQEQEATEKAVADAVQQAQAEADLMPWEVEAAAQEAEEAAADEAEEVESAQLAEKTEAAEETDAETEEEEEEKQ
jgi:large subunit ribosomal protein L9